MRLRPVATAITIGILTCSVVSAVVAATAAASPPGPARVASHAVAAAPARQPHAAAAPAARKGVSAWVFNGVDRSLRKSGATWYYTWAVSHPGITSPHGVSFVPMIWGAGSVTSANLHTVRREGHYLLGFNEPDNSGQSNMTVSQALRLWPRLMATRMMLGSPAVATGAATRGGWLDRFMRGARARHYRVNFITVHWYGGDFATRSAVAELRSYLRGIHARYRKPIWLTEFALIRFSATVTFPTAHQQAAFVTAATSMLRQLPYVHRYAWFALPKSPGDGTAGLFRSGAVATPAGRAFEAVRP